VNHNEGETVMTTAQKQFSKGSKVRYIGTRNKNLKGKVLQVLGPRGSDGVWLKGPKGKRASAMVTKLKKVA
jgi:hypothetical protein